MSLIDLVEPCGRRSKYCFGRGDIYEAKMLPTGMLVLLQRLLGEACMKLTTLPFPATEGRLKEGERNDG